MDKNNEINIKGNMNVGSSFNRYQMVSEEFANYPCQSHEEALSYLGLGIAGEAGEVANKIKKFIRGDYEMNAERMLNIAEELGDTLWYISEIARVLGFELEHIAHMNHFKLSERKKNGTIKGDGDGIRNISDFGHRVIGRVSCPFCKKHIYLKESDRTTGDHFTLWCEDCKTSFGYKAREV